MGEVSIATLLLEGLGLGVLLILICAFGIRNGAVGILQLYHKEVQDRCVELGLTTHEKIKRNSLMFKLCCLPMYIVYVLVCVREEYQGQGYMRKVMDIAFAEGNRLGLPVILDTDARSKCEKYMHLGMELAGTRDFGDFGTMYDLIKYPDKAGTGKKA